MRFISETPWGALILFDDEDGLTKHEYLYFDDPELETKILKYRDDPLFKEWWGRAEGRH